MIISYLKFLLSSSNQHGVHSPFIYNFVTKGLYNKIKPKLKHNKTEQLIFKIANYFNLNSVLIIGCSTKNIASLISETNSSSEIITNNGFTTLNSKLKDKKFDFIFLNHLNSILNFETLLNSVHNDSVLVINTPYNTTFWQQIKTHNAVTVTVDCFYIGVVFFRKEQAKQHFKIRV